MISVAIVDDDKQYLKLEKEYIQQYEEESGEQFQVVLFSNGMDFINDYKPVYDIVFLDIEMPLIDGMTVARKLRKLDNEICIVFITNMRQYAIEGYEVNAVDFVVKPLKYFNFIDKLKKALGFARMRHGKELTVKSDDGYFRVPVSQIYYIEKDKNYLVYHTERMEIRERGTIEKAEKQLTDCGFSKCNSGCLVNLRAVQQLTQTYVVVNNVQLPVSRRRAKELKSDMLNFLRGGV